MKETTLHIIGMSCGHCIEKIENVLKESGAEGEVKLGRATFRYDENRVSLEEVKAAIEDLGYDIA
ncbi:heavy-metal-associated domain-containing protein [Cohnella zeiphila]|uniref:Heavy-metal-associated domain-containing protein n=1 Tax=Cohnella zeiphila TaxID=2761120 RepID=A0A7X0SQE9_9BACL|nr:cation transporter [Cohnella zeiphila]MBB6734237.1 heavy-metal-associated domain-containing protein [Cohnella zeiphila]